MALGGCFRRCRSTASRRPRAFASLLGCAVALSACSTPETTPYLDLAAHLATAHNEGAIAGNVQASSNDVAGHLFLPAGARVSYAFFARPKSALTVDRVAIRGEQAELLVTLESDDLEARTLTLQRSSGGQSLDLELPGATPVRLTLEVISPAASQGDGALLTGPVISGRVHESAGETLAPPSPVARPNVIIYLIDTLRRDRLGAYGYDRPVSPAIDSFAQEATRFSRSYGQSSWTKPSIASMFTGFWPPRHGATGWKHRLAEEFMTLPELLREAGWTTAAFVTNINASGAFGIAQGFETIWYERRIKSSGVNQEVFDWLDTLDKSRPFLLYVHTMDPHAGYKPSEPYRSRFAPTADAMPKWKPRWRWPRENAPIFSDLYDGEIAQNDAAFGALLERLEELELYEDSLVIFLSDHGEEFLEHGGWRHNRRLYAETLDSPLVIKFPGQHEGRTWEEPVSHVDILPTVLDVVGLPPVSDAEGQSLVRPRDRPVFSHLRVGRYPLQYSVIRGHWKLIRMHKRGLEPRLELYDLETDPGESRDLASELPIRTAAMAALIDRHLAATGQTEAPEEELSEDAERRLRALGYLQ